MCEELAPYSLCWRGECVNGSCICDEGYSQNFEFYYKDIDSETTGFCDYNETAIVAVVSLVLVLTIFSLLVQLLVLDNLKQMKRVVPVLIAYSCFIVAAGIRLARSDESLFGYDVFYTYVFSITIFLVLTQQVIFLNKYIQYTLRLFEFNSFTQKYARILVKLNYLSFALLFIGSNLIALTSVVESQETSGDLVRAAAVIFGSLHLFSFINLYILFTKYISDLSSIVNRDQNVKVNSDFVEKCRINMSRIRIVRELCGVGNAWGVMLNFLALIFEGWLKLWVYLLYVNLFLFEVSAFFVVRAAGRTKPEEAFKSTRLVGSQIQKIINQTKVSKGSSLGSSDSLSSGGENAASNPTKETIETSEKV